MLYVAEERTAGGRLFHVLGPATANALSPIVDRRVADPGQSDRHSIRMVSWFLEHKKPLKVVNITL